MLFDAITRYCLKKITLKNQFIKLNSNFQNIRLILQFMLDLYRYNCRLNFIDIETNTNEFLFEKKKKMIINV